MKNKRILDNFAGYLTIGEDVFAYFIDKNIVTLLPAQSDYGYRQEVLDRVLSRNMDNPEYLFGIGDNNYNVAILRNTKISSDLLRQTPYVRFGSSLIIKSAGNIGNFCSSLTEKWRLFHAITFYGGNINALQDLQLAVDTSSSKRNAEINCDGSDEIRLRPWADCTRSIDIELDGEKVNLQTSIVRASAASDADNMDTYSLGTLHGSIRLTFETAQDFITIQKYYLIVKNLVALLTKQNNISFHCYLSQRASNGLLFKTADCAFFDHYANYSLKKHTRVIPIQHIFDSVPSLMEKIAKHEVDFILSLLPENNKETGLISITNVQDLCTALEIVYEWGKKKRSKDLLIEELKKRIKSTISEFVSHNKDIDINRETTISSSFQYLDYNLSQKILTLYHENSAVVDSVVSKYGLPIINEQTVGLFVKLRNSKTHAGLIEWGDSANIYSALFALVYVCLFKNIGISDEIIKHLINRSF